MAWYSNLFGQLVGYNPTCNMVGMVLYMYKLLRNISKRTPTTKAVQNQFSHKFWLKTCVLNTSQYALGGPNKKSLEEYLSIFASALLFDDGVTIAQQAANNQFSALNVLHLFPVNGIYLPSSYVMEMIYNQLMGTLSASKAKSSISTTINPGSVNFQSELDSLSSQKIFKYPRWRAISNRQLAAMSIEIRFLGNFMDIINSFGT